MSAGEEPRRRKGRLLAMMPVAVFALIGAGFYWGLFNGDDTLASPLIGKAVPEFDRPSQGCCVTVTQVFCTILHYLGG